MGLVIDEPPLGISFFLTLLILQIIFERCVIFIFQNGVSIPCPQHIISQLRTEAFFLCSASLAQDTLLIVYYLPLHCENIDFFISDSHPNSPLKGSMKLLKARADIFIMFFAHTAVKSASLS